MSDLFRLLPAKHVEHLTHIFITYEKRKVQFSLSCYQKDPIDLTMDYQQLGPDTKVTNDRDETEYLVKDDDFVSVFCCDLEKILVGRPKLDVFSLKYNKSKSETLEYRMNYLNPVRTRILKELLNILRRTGPELLKAKEITIESDNIDILMELFSYFDTDFLTNITIKIENDDNSMNFDRLWTLDLWKLERSLKVYTHISVMRNSVLESLKEAFFQHQYMRDVFILYKSVDPNFKLFFEDAHQESANRLHLHIPNTDNVIVRISQSDDNLFYFTRKFFENGYYHRYVTDLPGLSPVESDENLPNLKVDDERCSKVFGNECIMKKVTEFLKMKDVQSLLKVSCLVRHTIKELKLDFQIKKYLIIHEKNGKVSAILSNEELVPSRFQYISNGQGCIVKKDGTLQEKGKLISEEYRIRCLKDFAINMEHQKASLEIFFLALVNCHLACKEVVNHPTEFIEIFENFFESTNKLIRTKSLRINASSHHHISSVLKHIDPNFLKSIIICGPDKIPKHMLELDEMCKMDQWQNLNSITIHHAAVSTRVQDLDICRFSSGEITVNTLTTDDMIYLKEGFLASPSLEKFKIIIMNSEIDDTVNFKVGWPFRVANSFLRNQRSVWFLPILNTNKFLHIVYYVPYSVIFRHCDAEDVPEEFFENQL